MHLHHRAQINMIAVNHLQSVPNSRLDEHLLRDFQSVLDGDELPRASVRHTNGT
jgi:hypothetical protein